MKKFKVTVHYVVDIPYEDGLIDGFVNKNHLMYIACANLDKREFLASRGIYKYFLVEGNKETEI